MSTATEGRTLVKTGTPGWFKDLANPDGPNVRKKAGDVLLDETNGSHDEQAAKDERNARLSKIGEQATADTKPQTQPVQLSSGKAAVGRTVTIQCAWVDPDKRTTAQRMLFAGPTKDITFEKVVRAARGDEGAMPCGVERTIKAQDEFQVRFCTEHTKLRRNELRRIQNAAKTEAAKRAGTKKQ